MATKKTTTKKTTTAEKTTSKKSAAAKTAAETAGTKKSSGTETAAAEALETAVRVAREATHATVGAGFVVQDRLAQRKFEIVSYRTFLDEARTVGAERVTEVQDFFAPFAKRVTETVEPVAEKFEERLPSPVRDALVDGRQRVRELLDA